MQKAIKHNSVFIGLSLILIAVLGLALLYVPKSELHLILCSSHTSARDIFYRYYTGIAEWFPYVVCVLLLIFSRVGDGVFASSAMLLSALTTQIIKHLINAPRPVTWFAEYMPDVSLPLVEGVKMNLWHSFPSGHTTSFFALALVICILLTGKPKMDRISSIFIQILLFIAAAIGAYSRIYLSQHFAADVLAGIVIGILITLFCYAVFAKYSEQNWYNYHFFAKKV